MKEISAVVGKTSYDLFPERCPKTCVDTDNEVMRTGESLINVISFSPDLTNKCICTSHVPLYGKRGQIIGVAAI